MKSSTTRIRRGRSHVAIFLVILYALTCAVTGVRAADWVRVYSEDKKVSAEFPDDITKRMQTAIEKTAAGDVATNFATWIGDGIVFGASGSKVPGVAFLLGKNTIFNSTRKKMLAKAFGVETGFQEITFGGQPARVLDYNSAPGAPEAYTAKAILLLVGKKMYTVTSVITKDTATNRALEDKLAGTIQVH